MYSTILERVMLSLLDSNNAFEIINSESKDKIFCPLIIKMLTKTDNHKFLVVPQRFIIILSKLFTSIVEHN